MAEVTYAKCPMCGYDTPQGMFCGQCGARLDGQIVEPARDEARVMEVIVPDADETVSDEPNDGGASSEVLADPQAVIPESYDHPVLQETAQRIRTMNGNGKVNGNGNHEEADGPIDDTPFRPIIKDILRQREQLSVREADLVELASDLTVRADALKIREDLSGQREGSLANRECELAEQERRVQNLESGHREWIEETEKDLRARNAELDERVERLLLGESELVKSEQANRNRVDVIGRRETLVGEAETRQLSRAESIVEMERMISERTNTLNQREASLDARESAIGQRENVAKKVAKSENVQVLIHTLIGLAVAVGAIVFMVWMSKQ
ncbi:MAG: hypothetical protein AAB575_04885 [Patescibacteria group bacterium]